MLLSPLPLRHKNGFVLITVLMILLILTILGIMATGTSIIELMISGNDKVHKQTFYQADGGTELAERLVFENAVCASTQDGFSVDLDGKTTIGGNVVVENKIFAEKKSPLANPVVTDINRAAAYYPTGTINDSSPHTNFLAQFSTEKNPGTGMQMISGYEGLGAGSAGGGTHRRYEISSQHYGLVNSQTLIVTHWRIDNFILSSAAPSDCKY